MTSVLNLVRCTVDPVRYNTIPPSSKMVNSFSQKVDYYGQFTVSPTSETDVVNTSSGFVLWQFHRGLQNMFRFGYLSAGEYHSDTVGIMALYGCDALVVHTPVPLPFGTLGGMNNSNVTISSTAQDANLAFVRPYAGVLRMLCDTMSVGTVALNGQFTAAAISDIRGIYQYNPNGPVSTANGTTSSLNSSTVPDPASLAQQATSYKDVVKDVPVGKGVVVTMGPDVADTFVDVNSGSTYNHFGECNVRLIPSNFLYQVPCPPPFTQTDFYQAWVSPYAISMKTSATHNESFCNVLPINPVNGAYIVEFRMEVRSAGAAGSVGYLQNVHVEFRHITACVNDNHVVGYESTSDYQLLLVNTHNTSFAPGYENSLQVRASSDARKFINPSFVSIGPGQSSNQVNQVAGLYIGTHIRVSLENFSNVAPPAGVVAVVQDSSENQQLPNNVNNIGPCIIVSSACDRATGEIGPNRIIHYSGLQPGQTVKLDGMMMCECVAGGSTSSFVQQGNIERTCLDLNALPFLSALYNSMDTPFRRAWELPDYVEFCKQMTTLTPSKLRSIATNDAVLSAGSAAGVFKRESEEELECCVNTHTGSSGKRQPSAKRKMESDEDTQSVLSVLQNSGMAMAAPYTVQPTVSNRLAQLDRIMNPIQRGIQAAAMARAQSSQFR